jgi:phosphoribosylaminoimidazole (AIR) synthetase
LNLGIGLVMIVSKRDSDVVSDFIRKKGERCIVVGEVIRSVR